MYRYDGPCTAEIQSSKCSVSKVSIYFWRSIFSAGSVVARSSPSSPSSLLKVVGCIFLPLLSMRLPVRLVLRGFLSQYLVSKSCYSSLSLIMITGSHSSIFFLSVRYVLSAEKATGALCLITARGMYPVSRRSSPYRHFASMYKASSDVSSHLDDFWTVWMTNWVGLGYGTCTNAVHYTGRRSLFVAYCWCSEPRSISDQALIHQKFPSSFLCSTTHSTSESHTLVPAVHFPFACGCASIGGSVSISFTLSFAFLLVWVRAEQGGLIFPRLIVQLCCHSRLVRKNCEIT